MTGTDYTNPLIHKRFRKGVWGLLVADDTRPVNISCVNRKNRLFAVLLSSAFCNFTLC